MRATKAPDKWQLVLDAIYQDDYELANKLAVKYNFASEVYKEKIVDNVRPTPLKGDYVAMDPDGKMYCHEFGTALSRYLGLVQTYVGTSAGRLGGGEVKKGMMKGWKFWREK